MVITRQGWKTKHALLAIIETEFRAGSDGPDNTHDARAALDITDITDIADDDMQPRDVTYRTAKNFVEAMSWYIDETTFDTHLGAFVTLPRPVVFESLGAMWMCTSIATKAIADQATAAKVLAFAEKGRTYTLT